MKPDSKKLLLDFRNVDIYRYGKRYYCQRIFIIDVGLSPTVIDLESFIVSIKNEIEKTSGIPKKYFNEITP